MHRIHFGLIANEADEVAAEDHLHIVDLSIVPQVGWRITFSVPIEVNGQKDVYDFEGVADSALVDTCSDRLIIFVRVKDKDMQYAYSRFQGEV